MAVGGVLTPLTVIVAVAGAEIAELDDLQRALGEARAGLPLAITLLRRGERQELLVVPREA